jgi:two-component system, NtrC family, sensor kinase
VRWTSREQNVVLTVADNGCGISPELQEKVFQPLFTTKPVGIGTGLGLSICRELVTQAGGGVRLSSKQGDGTEVELTLQRAQLP